MSIEGGASGLAADALVVLEDELSEGEVVVVVVVVGPS
jgi:hypothetical protein